MRLGPKGMDPESHHQWTPDNLAAPENATGILEGASIAFCGGTRRCIHERCNPVTTARHY